MSSPSSQPIQGMSDLVAPEVYLWQSVESAARRVLHRYDFEEIRTPILERTDVFLHSLGDTTDVVQKEMYSFEDRGGRHLTLRPEGTAGVMRHLAGRGPEAAAARLYYLGPMFRSERPQAGRKRQFHQLGVEAMGPPNPAADAEVLALQLHLLAEFGLTQCKVRLNTRGTPEELDAIREGLREAVRPHFDDLGEDDRRRFDENVLRILDSKDEATRRVVESIPAMTTFLSAEARDYLQAVADHLAALNIEVELDPNLVRGLDYYVHTVWEISHPALGAQDALSGGGRYQMELAGKTLEGVGFAMGLERVLVAIEAEAAEREPVVRPTNPLIWLVSLGDEAFRGNQVLAQTLRQRGSRCRMDLTGRSMKAQMRAANRAGAACAVIRGEREVEQGTFQFKNMEDGSQDEVDMPELLERLGRLRIQALE